MLGLATILFPVCRVLEEIYNRRRGQGNSYWGYSASCECNVVETTLTCTGTGTLTSDIIKATGSYGMITRAIVNTGITEIGKTAFKNCRALVEISLPSSGLTTIGREAFAETAIVTLALPKSLTSIDPEFTTNCSKLQRFSMFGSGSGSYSVSDGILLNQTAIIGVPCAYATDSTITLPSGKSILNKRCCAYNQAKRIVVPSGITTIGDGAFYGCVRMTELSLPSSLTSLSRNALSSCIKLTTISGTIGSGNSAIWIENGMLGTYENGNKYSIYWVDVSRSSITIPDTVWDLGNTAVQSCPNLSVALGGTTNYNLTCGNKVLFQISSGAAKACIGSATSVTLDSDITFIGFDCFRGCTKLETVTLHSGVTRFSQSAFRECPALHTIDFKGCRMYKGDGTTPLMDEMMFQDCPSLTTINNWPTSNTWELGAAAFRNSGLVTLDLPDSVTNIQRIACMGCDKLKTLMIPSRVTTLGESCFSYCYSLETVTFKDVASSRLTTIESMAFAYCTSLRSIQLPSTITSMTASCFACDTSLAMITFNAATGSFRSDGIAVYQVSGSNYYHTLIICPPGVHEIKFRDSTNAIGDLAFYCCDKLVSVIMNDEITRIESRVFIMCSAIEYIRLPAQIQYIGRKAFDSCVRLKQIRYCGSNTNVDYSEGDPFPTNPSIYVRYNFTETQFCGHNCDRILDLECNIPPTQSFTVHMLDTVIRKRKHVLMVFHCAYVIHARS